MCRGEGLLGFLYSYHSETLYLTVLEYSPQLEQWEDCGHTGIVNQCSCAQKQEIHGLLFNLDGQTDLIHSVDQAGVCLDEDILAFRVHCLAFGCNALSSFLGAADEVRVGLMACLANCLGVVSPIPLVAPTKTATRPGRREEVMRKLENCISGREIIV